MDAASKAFGALSSISCSSTDYETWLKLGIAFRDAGGMAADWLSWCSNDPARYDERAAMNVFENPQQGTTSNGSRPTTALTLWKLAYENGWQNPDGDYKTNAASDSNAFATAKSSTLSPEEQMASQLKAMFKDDEFVCIATDAKLDKHGKWKPASRGKFYRVAELIALLKTKSIEDVIGPYNHEAGAWICVNPVDGKGRSDTNVSDYRFALIESDTLGINKQINIILKSQAPVATLTESGSKSVHALVRVDAEGPRHYSECVRTLHAAFNELGLEVDAANKNPSRLTRLAGVERNGCIQKLLTTDIGESSFEVWRDKEIDAKEHAKPEVEHQISELSTIVPFDASEEPQLTPELISGVLRQGHKLCITGASKSYKSWAAIQLAQAIAVGGLWLGFACKQTRVLYINCEVDPASFTMRLLQVANRNGYSAETLKSNLDVLNLRGHCEPLEDLAPKLIAAIAGKEYGAIILDPLYKVNGGDENSAHDITVLVGAMDFICTKTGASLIYIHHHSKGVQGDKSAIDRGSGSGVFGRDADAAIDFIGLEVSDDLREEAHLKEGDSVWRVGMSLREFKTPDPFEVVFSFPRHQRIQEPIFAECKPMTSAMKGGKIRALQREAEAKQKAKQLEDLLEQMLDETDSDYVILEDLQSTIEDVAVCNDGWWHDVRTTRKHINACQGFRLVKIGKENRIERV